MSDQPSNLSPRDRLPDRMQELAQLLEACADPAGSLLFKVMHLLTFMKLGDAPDDERNSRVEVLG